MPTKPIRRAAVVAGGVAAMIAGTATAPALAAGQPAHGSQTPIRHVLLISVDGLHQQDLAWYVRTHPHSALARLESHGLEYSRARTPFPSDSFTGPVPGGAVDYDESDDVNTAALDAGQGLAGLPGSILQMTSNPVSVINPAALPVDPATCKPILPNRYLQVNTIFNVARRHGLRT